MKRLFVVMGAFFLCALMGCGREKNTQAVPGTPEVATERAVVDVPTMIREEERAPAGPTEPKAIHSPMPVPHDLPVPGKDAEPPSRQQDSLTPR